MATDVYANMMKRLKQEEERENPVATKTASEKTESTVTADDGLSEEMAAIKTASEKTVVANEVESMVKEASEREKAALVKEARDMGIAMADGFVQRMAAYQAQQKIASEQTAETEKVAAEAHAEGHQEGVAAIAKTAAELHFQGQTIVDALAKAWGENG